MRTRLMRGKFTHLFMMLGLLLAVPAIAFAQDSTGGPSPAPTIQSDLPDYEPGGLVTLTGGGWQPGEAVNIVVNDDAGQTWNRNVNVTADASGNIIDSFNLPAWFVATYSVKATGASGTVATSSFTDASVTVHRGPTGNPPNVTFTVAYARFADPLCTGTGTNPGTAVVDSDLGTPLGGLGNSNFIKLTAPMTPTTPSGYTFDNWTAVAGSANTTITQVPNTPNAICVRNPTASTNDIYRATYKVAQQATSITQVSGSGTYGGNATLTAKLTQGANNLNGKTVEFKLRNNAVCDNDANTALQACPTTDANGVATLNIVSLSGIDSGGPTGTGYAGAVSATFAGGTGFSSSTSTGNLTVNMANQTITFPAPTGKTFGDADFDPGATASSGLAVSYSSSTPGVCTIVSGKVHIVSAGTCTVTASQAGNANYNPAPNVTRSFSIGAAQGNVTLSNLTQTYDGSAKSVGVTTTPSGLNVSVTYNGNAQAPTNAGSYNVVATINDPNYQGSATGTLKIDKALLSVNAKDQSTVYGDSNLPPSYELSGFVNNETAASAGVTGAANCAISNTGGPNVGTYSGAISCDAGSLAAQNYSFAPGTKGTLSITKAELKVNADNQSKTYGDANPNLTYTFSGFKNGDTAGSVTTSGSASCSIDPSAGPNVGTYSGAITCAPGNLSAANYTFAAGTNGELTITKRATTYTADAKTKTYGEDDPALTGKITSGNLVGSDSLSGNLARVTGENVGTYAINQGTLSAGGNYELTYNGAKLTIDKRAIEVTADDKTKTYGEDDPTLTHSVTSGNLVNGDAFTGSLQREEGQNVGTYAINQGTLSAGGNYELTFKSGTLTIEKADLTVTADDKSKTYGDANPNFTVSYSGFVNGDDKDDLGGTLAFDTNATQQSSVGTYDVTPKGLTSGNYNIDFVKGTLTINKAPLTVTADNKTKILGAANPNFTASYSGFKNGETQSVLSGSPALSTNATQSSNVGTYTISAAAGTLSANNYSFTFKDGTLNIIYNFSVASGAGFLQPINYTAHQLSTGPDVSTFKAGSTVPVKFVLKDANGNVVQAASPPQWLTPAKGSATSQPVDEAVYSDPATIGATYKWTGSQYHYNWASPKNGSGYFWRIGVKLDDGQIYYVNISLR